MLKILFLLSLLGQNGHVIAQEFSYMLWANVSPIPQHWFNFLLWYLPLIQSLSSDHLENQTCLLEVSQLLTKLNRN